MGSVGRCSGTAKIDRGGPCFGRRKRTCCALCMPPPASSKTTDKAPKSAGPAGALARPGTAALPAPIPRYLARCTFVGEDKKVRIEGSFRFVADAADLTTFLPKLEKAVNKLRRTKELPPRCQVYVEFVIELADSKAGMLVDFERWERHPRRFQTGHITTAENCAAFTEGLPTFQFGPEQPAAAQ